MRPDEIRGGGEKKSELNSGLDGRSITMLSRTTTQTYRSSGLFLRDGQLFQATDLIKRLKIDKVVKEAIAESDVARKMAKFPKRVNYLVGFIDKSEPRATGLVISALTNGNGGFAALSAFGGVAYDYPRRPHLFILPVVKTAPQNDLVSIRSLNVAIDPFELTLRAEDSEARPRISAQQNAGLEQFIQSKFPNVPVGQILHVNPSDQ